MKVRSIILFIILLGCSSKLPSKESRDSVFLDQENISTDIRLKGVKNEDNFLTRNTFTSQSKYDSNNINHDFGFDWSKRKVISLSEKDNRHFSYLGSPIIVDDIIYIVNTNGYIVAIDEKSESTLWKKKLNSGLNYKYATLSYHNDHLIATTNNGYIYLVSRSGLIIWEKYLGSSLISGFVYNNGRLYGLGLDNIAYCIDLESGSTLWSNKIENNLEASSFDVALPVIIDNDVIFACRNGEIAMFDKISGQKKWSSFVDLNNADIANENASIDFSPIIEKNMLFTGSIDGGLSFFSSERGYELKNFGMSLYSPIAKSANFYYFITKENKLICFYPISGTVKWIKDLPKDFRYKVPKYLTNTEHYVKYKMVWRGPIIADGKIIISDIFGDILVIDPNTGDTIQNIQIPEYIYRTPVIVNGKMYIYDDYKKEIIIIY
jgi:outer membrane protein assembly factor BamB